MGKDFIRKLECSVKCDLRFRKKFLKQRGPCFMGTLALPIQGFYCNQDLYSLNLNFTFTVLDNIKAIQSKRMGTILVNILVSALPNKLPPK